MKRKLSSKKSSPKGDGSHKKRKREKQRETGKEDVVKESEEPNGSGVWEEAAMWQKTVPLRQRLLISSNALKEGSLGVVNRGMQSRRLPQPFSQPIIAFLSFLFPLVVLLLLRFSLSILLCPPLSLFSHDSSVLVSLRSINILTLSFLFFTGKICHIFRSLAIKV